MKKLVLFSAALLLAGHAGAHAQGDHGKYHKRLMSSHAQSRGHEGGMQYRAREYAPEMIAPSYGDDPSAIGRTSGG